MSEIKIKTEFVVEGLSFSTRKEAEQHVAFVELHRNVCGALRNYVMGFGVSQDEFLGLVLNHIISDRVNIRNIFNGISDCGDDNIDLIAQKFPEIFFPNEGKTIDWFESPGGH